MSEVSTSELSENEESECRRLIRMALDEDLASCQASLALDCTTESIVPPGCSGQADFVSRQEGVICGVRVCHLVLEEFGADLDLTVTKRDGEPIKPAEIVATLSGSARHILVVERTCLNFLGRLSGVATLTARFVAETAGTKARIFDTRKTTPGWRYLQKVAVRTGGGFNHRIGLFDAVLIKDNHLAMLSESEPDVADPIRVSISRAREWIRHNSDRLPNGENTIVQIEVDDLGQLESAFQESPDIVLLDNMSNEQLQAAVKLRDETAPGVELEASGGVTLQTVRSIAQTGVDRISVGALTHSAMSLDLGLDWRSPSRF